MICSRCKREIDVGKEKVKVIETQKGIFTLILCEECFREWGKINIQT